MNDEHLIDPLTAKGQQYLTKVQSEIYYCYNCQPYEGGEPFWIQGDQISVGDLMDSCKVPPSYQTEIVPNLYCPNCGTSHFDLYSDVGRATKYEKELSAREKKIKSIHRGQVQSLEALLQESPMLGLTHPFGRKILKEIIGRKMPTTTVEGKLYRARRIDGEQIFATTDMLHAPTGKPRDGRFNHAGQSHLYLSTEKETALKEVIDRSCIVWLTSVTLAKPVEQILDLDVDWTEDFSPSSSILLHALIIGNSLTRSDRNRENWTPDYYLTKFIMDCARKSGYNGIRYRSAKSPGSSNYVLFHPDMIQFKRLGKPRLVVFKKSDENLPRPGKNSTKVFSIVFNPKKKRKN